jgi:molybdopterin synthase sulfur carrier subunit
MRIKVRGYLSLRDVIGGQPFRIIEGEQLTLQDLVLQLSQDLGDEFDETISASASPASISPHLAVLINGRHYSHLPDRLQTQLEDGDEVSIFPPVAGGE